MDVIAVQDLRHTYRSGPLAVEALRGVAFAVPAGQMAAIMGPSGSGKSTLLHVLGCLMRVEEGSYHLGGLDVTGLRDDDLAELRGRQIGFVFQAYNLVPQLTALENVALPLAYQGVGAKRRQHLAREMLERVGLGDRAGHRPLELSGGQQQRVGIARAMVTDPAVILADEPTGNLDSASGEAILALFAALHQEGRTVVIVTHAAEVAGRCERTIQLRDGLVASDERKEGSGRLEARG